MRIVIALLVFSFIIIIHELGHFLLAKKNGIMVNEFSLGMGPRLLSYKGKETRYSLKLFPIGGSCMMLGEDDTSDDPRSFNKKGVWARISVIAGGPIFNFILAFVLAMFVVGFTGIDEPVVTSVTEGFAAEEAGLQQGDVITSIDGKSVNIGRDISVHFNFHPITSNKPIEVGYEREGKSYTALLKPTSYEKFLLGFGYNADETAAVLTAITEGGAFEKAGLLKGDTILAIDGTAIKTGNELTNYINKYPLTSNPVKITYSRNGEEGTIEVTPKSEGKKYTIGLGYNEIRSGKQTNPLKIVKYSYTEVKFWIKTTVVGVGQLITGKVSTDQISGPVGIVNMIGDSYEAARQVNWQAVFLQIAYIVILLSANLGVMNLLPIPALDGGRLVFLLIEAIRGKPIPVEKEGLVHFIGFVLLMLLMVFVVYNDLIHIFG